MVLFSPWSRLWVSCLCVAGGVIFVGCGGAWLQAAEANHGWGHAGKALEAAIHLITLGKKLKRNALPPVTTGGGKTIHLVDGLSLAQVPPPTPAPAMHNLA